tara:strand:- start:372 stop:2507 length:2136 start_codon:yes stop_codon:yes gene_type:complete
MNFSKNGSKYISKTNNSGFAIPQILILGIGIAVGISGLMATSILGLTGSKITRQELLAKASSYSGITKLRALFNDNSEGRLLNYFWLVDNCSEKASECQSLNVSDPTNQYWADDSWCNNEENCNGRQKAPVCTPNNNYSWANEKQIVENLFSNTNYVGNTLDNSERDFNQAFNIISTKYVGTEDSGINSILIEGLSIPKDSNNISGSNKLRVNIQVNSETTESGFGFFSVGENNSDQTDSLFIGNLDITPLNTAKGSIIWRMNIDDTNNCQDFQKLAKAENASLPVGGNGGIWIQPINLPRQPRLKNVIDIGTLICTEKRFAESNTDCKLSAGNLPEKTFRIYSLFVRGPGSKFEISTTEKSKIILEIMGDIDISNGGIFCHKNGIDSCGTGKPENLTILFKQKNNPQQNKLVCNRENNYGGVKFKNNYIYTNIGFPIENDRLPGHSFLIDKTGENYEQKFGAFIYGPQTTFISTTQKSKWIQDINSVNPDSSSMIITSRGSYGYILNTLNKSIEGNITNLILDSDLTLIPYGGYQENGNNLEIIGIGKKVGGIPTGSQFSSTNNNVFLIFDNSTLNYHLRSFKVININRLNSANLQYGYPRSFAKLDIKNSLNDINLGSSLEENTIANNWLNAFEIKVKEKNENYKRNFSGAVWVKNLCFDSTGDKSWEFSKDFVDKLVKWHGSNFNWGKKDYRGKSIILWDTLRDFNAN